MVISSSNSLMFFSKITALSQLVSKPIQKFTPLTNLTAAFSRTIYTQHQNLTPFKTSQACINLRGKVRHFSDDSPRRISASVYRLGANEVHKLYTTASTKELSLYYLLICSFLGTAFLIENLKKASAEEGTDEQLERIRKLLRKDPSRRTIEEKMELFNFLLKKGEEEASKAKGKEVVMIFGNTGAGKSTLVNFLFGCQMKKNGGEIIVDPNSRIKEVAKIGSSADSCTFIPKKIPDICVSYLDPYAITEDNVPLKKQSVLTIYDMPGLGDTRGIEVALANLITTKKLLKNAQSARFIMVVEGSVITAMRGDIWKESVQLLEDTFDKNVGIDERSLCLIVTQTEDDLEKIKLDIKKHTPLHRTDLSSHARTYNPLNPHERDELLEIIRETEAHKGLDSKITMGKSQLWSALKLGDVVRDEVLDHLNNGNEYEVQQAVKKAEFTHGIANLNNADLKKPHEAVKAALLKHSDTYLEDISPKNNPPIENQIDALRKYIIFKNKFRHLADFSSLDKRVRVLVNDTKNPEWIRWNEPQTTLVGMSSTLALTALGLVFPPFWIAAAGTGVASLYALIHWVQPTQKEKDRSEFFNGP